MFGSWRKAGLKFSRALRLAETLPAARRLVTIDLRSEGLTRERVLAAAFRMLDSGSLRVGSEPYTNENGSHGLATLLCAHVAVRKEGLRLIFPAKSGKTWESRIEDADLAAVVRLLKGRGGNARLLAYKDGRAWHPVSSAEINAYVKERAGEDFTAKDFRTLRATVAAAVSLAQSGPQRQVSARKRPSAGNAGHGRGAGQHAVDRPGELCGSPSAGPLRGRRDHRLEAPGLGGIRAAGTAVPRRRGRPPRCAELN